MNQSLELASEIEPVFVGAHWFFWTLVQLMKISTSWLFQASGLLTDRFTVRSMTLAGGIGAFGANIVGHVTDTPGQARWEGVGIGLTCRTPWSGQLSVGADNVITRGKNPFSLDNGGDGQADDGAVPYIRYEQDL